MYNTGDFVEVTASNEDIECVGADLQLKKGDVVKVIKTWGTGWICVEGIYLDSPCEADVPPYFLKKV